MVKGFLDSVPVYVWGGGCVGEAVDEVVEVSIWRRS